MAWDTFIETTLQCDETTSSGLHQDTSAQHMEVGSSSKSEEVPKEPRPEVNKIDQRGKRLVFIS